MFSHSHLILVTGLRLSAIRAATFLGGLIQFVVYVQAFEDKLGRAGGGGVAAVAVGKSGN